MSFPTIRTNFNGPLLRSKSILQALHTIRRLDVVLAASPNQASSGQIRGCSDADTANQYLSREKDASILSWPTTTGH